MTAPWLLGPSASVSDGSVTVMEGTTFCISDAVGDFPFGSTSGLFVRDTRMLSTWAVRVDGRRLIPLGVAYETPYAVMFMATIPADDGASELVVVRERAVGNGMREEISIFNPHGEAVPVSLALEVAADFADLFEVKEGAARHDPGNGDLGPAAALHITPADSSISSGRYAVEVRPDAAPTTTPEGLSWLATIPAHGRWRTTIEVVVSAQGATLPLHHPRDTPLQHAEPYRRRESFRRAVPRLETPGRVLTEVLRRSIDDLATLRIIDPERVQLPVVAAGAPWFMALFGRDSLLTSTMLLPIDVSLASGTAQTLAAHQGSRVDRRSEEQPGRILHETRFGPAGTLALGGGTAYYGTADATPLFVMLLGELVRWGGKRAVPPALVHHADRALAWTDTHGDPDGDGFVEYHRTNDNGLRNQGWKDSWDGVNFANGDIAEPPIALAEVQAYTYAARLARAAIADAYGDPETAGRWRTRAEELKQAFNSAFWLPDRGWYAIALDRDKRPVDALTSNNGHCLWTGIADADKAAVLAPHLLSPELFTGWGIRTLATNMGAYQPMSYHNGSVWPHDTAICVGGLARYGFMAEAGTVATGLLEAARHFGYRLPELFAGFSRSDVPAPVPYPSACSPQAWAAAAPVELLRALLRLEPDGDGLRCNPVVPPQFLPLRLTGVMCRGREHVVEVDRDGSWRIHTSET